MLRAVLDVNVLVSAAISPDGTPARLLERSRLGAFELIISGKLREELERALGYQHVVKRIPGNGVLELIALLDGLAISRPDPNRPPLVTSADPNDDYLTALASAENAYLVTGDKHLLDLADQIPVVSPSQFVEILDSWESGFDG